jgi:putative oxidoreductase
MSTNSASLEAPGNGAIWVVQVLGAVLFFIAGFPKLSGDEQMIQTFAAIGIGQWLRYVTGLMKFGSAILLLIPTLSGLVTLLLVPMMIGAILTHLLIIGGSPALPVGVLIVVSVVAWGRAETTLRLIWSNKSKSRSGEGASSRFGGVPSPSRNVRNLCCNTVLNTVQALSVVSRSCRIRCRSV